MAKKNIDFGKLDLGKKKEVKKQVVKNEDIPDKAVEVIHNTPQPKVETQVKERTKRVTLDIPISLHAEIRKLTFDKGITMKTYFLDLAKKDMGL